MLKISVITAVYNAVKSVEDAILSVVSQTYPCVEHVIIDGASTDGTLEVIRKHSSRISKLISEPDKGIYDAMNKGIALATGDVIGLLNADDMYEDSEVLARVAQAMSNQKADACYGDLIYVDPLDKERVVRYWKSRPYEHGLFEKGWMPAHPTFFVRSEVYERYGKFDLNFQIQSDFELTMRFMAVHKIKAVYIPKVLVKMRMGGVTNNSVSNVIRGNLEAYRACKKHGLRVTPLFFARKIGSRIPQFFVKYRD